MRILAPLVSRGIHTPAGLPPVPSRPKVKSWILALISVKYLSFVARSYLNHLSGTHPIRPGILVEIHLSHSGNHFILKYVMTEYLAVDAAWWVVKFVIQHLHLISGQKTYESQDTGLTQGLDYYDWIVRCRHTRNRNYSHGAQTLVRKGQRKLHVNNQTYEEWAWTSVNVYILFIMDIILFAKNS